MTTRRILIADKMQQDYSYELVAPEGKHFHPEFQPQLTPPQMLEMGVFGGKYMTDCQNEFPSSWFENAKLSPDCYDKELNLFGVKASQPLAEWRRKGWIWPDDPRGWFQWYCRYYLGRRCEDDERQIQRWKNMKRHVTQVRRNCEPYDMDCRPKQRQALLHWAYDPTDI